MDLLDTLYNQSMPVRDGLLDIRNRLARIEVLWASLGAAHDRVASVKLEGIVEFIEALVRHCVTAVVNPSVRLHEHS